VKITPLLRFRVSGKDLEHIGYPVADTAELIGYFFNLKHENEIELDSLEQEVLLETPTGTVSQWVKVQEPQCP
jgi:hypothetical protein